jgi:hypothetical protein
MNLVKDGWDKIADELASMEPNWDGYSAKVIDKGILERFRDTPTRIHYIAMFKSIGIPLEEINVTPSSEGTIQFEGEYKSEFTHVYFEIELNIIP